MKLLLIENYMADQQKSMLRYGAILKRLALSKGVELESIAPDYVFGRLAPKNSILGKWLRYLDKFVLFWPKYQLALRKHSHIHICDHSNAIYVLWSGARTVSITCHDVIAIQAARGQIEGWTVGATGKLFQHLILWGISRASIVFCVSSLTKRDLVSLAPQTADRAILLPNPLDPTLTEEAEGSASVPPPLGLRSAGYFLHVGSALPRKNRRAVVGIVAELRRHPRFVEAQALFVGPEPDAELAAFISDLNMGNACHFVQNVDTKTLCACYKHAIGLIFPSENEGFGWPIIEAQSMGCPVFAADIPPLPEVGGTAAVYIPSRDFPAAASRIIDADLATMRRDGFINCDRYSLEQMWKTFSTGVGLHVR